LHALQRQIKSRVVCNFFESWRACNPFGIKESKLQ
jgi:hypothetical protein